jgi:CspA family cold shock protein
MATGTVILFKADKGYGFIKPDDNGPNVYVHISALDGLDMNAFVIGAAVRYDIKTEDHKISAVNVILTAH